MSQIPAFIARLTDDRVFGPAERARFRELAGRGLERDTLGFDVFTGLWWPLRKKPGAPRREVAWLIAKLYGAIPVPHVRPSRGKGPPLAQVLGRVEPRHPACRRAALLTGPVPDREPARSQFITARRFRRRFDALLCKPLGELEPPLRWALSIAGEAVVAGRSTGIDWVQLTDHLSIWDRGEEHGGDYRLRRRDVRDLWAEQYLKAAEREQRKEI